MRRRSNLLRVFVGALTLLGGGIVGATAAELPLKAPPPAPPPFDWTGFYLGINGGAGWGTAESSVDIGETLAGLGIPGVAATLPLSSQSIDGFLFGGQAGYNYQVGRFVMGIEGDIDWADIEGTSPCLLLFNCTTKVKWTADITGRLGFLPIESLLVYIKGGGAWANAEHTFGNSITVGALTASVGSSLTTTQFGGLFGMGAEYAFDRHWSGKIEYDFADYGKENDNFAVTAAVTGVGSATATVAGQTKLEVHTVKAGVNYRF